MPIEVTRTYFEMTRSEELVPAASPTGDARVERAALCPPSFYRYLYTEVGRAHYWVDRAGWTDDRTREHLASPAVSVYVLSLGGVPAGYFELQRHGDGSVEIALFGLLPEFKGRGLGKYLLTEAVKEAWGRGAARVWLHTCDLDDPVAVPNYRGRGFRDFKQETYWIESSDDGLEPGSPLA